jgi:hypothetical protein
MECQNYINSVFPPVYKELELNLHLFHRNKKKKYSTISEQTKRKELITGLTIRSNFSSNFNNPAKDNFANSKQKIFNFKNLSTNLDLLDEILVTNVKNNKQYQQFAKINKKIAERIKSTIYLSEIQFSLLGNKDGKSVINDSLPKKEIKELVTRIINGNDKIKNKQKIVREDDYSFSDDSLDYDLIPIVKIIFY